MCGVFDRAWHDRPAAGLVWHMWWLAVCGFTFSLGTAIARSFMRDVRRTIPAAEVEAQHRRWLETTAAALPIPRQLEMTPENEGLAKWQG